MLKNVVKTAYRNLAKNKVSAGVNLIGFALGICISVLVLLFVESEWTHDSFHAHAEQIYRVNPVYKADLDEQRMESFRRRPRRFGTGNGGHTIAWPLQRKSVFFPPSWR